MRVSSIAFVFTILSLTVSVIYLLFNPMCKKAGNVIPPPQTCETCPTVVIPDGAASTLLEQQFQGDTTITFPINTYFPHGYSAKLACPVCTTQPATTTTTRPSQTLIVPK